MDNKDINLYNVVQKEKELLQNRLEPITDWSKVASGEEIFHITSNSILNHDIFKFYDASKNLVHYNNSTDMTKIYYFSDKDWYYYDYGNALDVKDECKKILLENFETEHGLSVDSIIKNMNKMNYILGR